MPEYRITVNFVVGDPVQGVRHHPRFDMEVVRPFFEKKVYEVYGKAKVAKIEIERIKEPGIELSE